MSKQDNTIDDRLIFSRFGSLSDQRQALYSDYIEIDEKNEISEAWVKFSSNVVNDLLSVVKLTKSLYERLVDGLRRSKNAPTKEELSRVKALTEFWLDLSVMSYLYSTIEKRGLFGEEGSAKVNQKGYIETKKSIDELIILAFKIGNEFFTDDARITLGEELFLTQQKRQLDYLDLLDDSSEDKLKQLGEYDLKQAHFLITRVKQSLIDSSESWWWRDPIAMYSSSEHALDHIKSMNIHWAKCTSDLINQGLMFTATYFGSTQAFSNFSLAQHYKRLGIAALNKRANRIAADYFKQAVNLTVHIPVENINMKSIVKFWGSSTHNQILIFQQMAVLSEISSDYEIMIAALIGGELDEVKKIVTNSLQKLNDVLSSGDVAYVTSVAVTYETVFSYLDEQLRGTINAKEAIKFIEKRLDTTSDRLHQATHQLSKKWIRIINKDPENLEGLDDLINNFEGPMLAIFILPPENKHVISSTSEIQAILTATEALEISLEADEVFGLNPVKEMLMRSKAHKLSIEAQKIVEGIPDEEIITLIKNLLKPMEQSSLLRGLIAEIQLKSAVLQYQFVNRIASLIENSVLTNPEADRLAAIDESELNLFITDIELIQLAAETIVNNKAPINIQGLPLDWTIFEALATNANALGNLIKTVIHAITAIESSTKEDSINNWNEAKDIAQETSDSLSKSQKKEVKQLGEQLFSLTQMYRDYENMARDGKKLPTFPIQGIIALLQQLVMSI